jgi:hypothetical protein
MQCVHLNAEAKLSAESTPRLVRLLAVGMCQDEEEPLANTLDSGNRLMGSSKRPGTTQTDKESCRQREEVHPTGKDFPAGPPHMLDKVKSPFKPVPSPARRHRIRSFRINSGTSVPIKLENPLHFHKRRKGTGGPHVCEWVLPFTASPRWGRANHPGGRHPAQSAPIGYGAGRTLTVRVAWPK